MSDTVDSIEGLAHDGGSSEGESLASGGTGMKGWLGVGFLILMIAMIIYAATLESWRTSNDTDREYGLFSADGGLDSTSFEDEYEHGDCADDNSPSCQMIEDVMKAGEWSAILFGIGALIGLTCIILTVLSSSEGIRKLSVYSAYTAGGLITLGWITWFVIFPDSGYIDFDAEYGYGLGFGLAVISGLLGLTSGGLMAAERNAVD